MYVGEGRGNGTGREKLGKKPGKRKKKKGFKKDMISNTYVVKDEKAGLVNAREKKLRNLCCAEGDF